MLGRWMGDAEQFFMDQGAETDAIFPPTPTINFLPSTPKEHRGAQMVGIEGTRP